jgi:Double sensory domain of two-component sensor kinase
MSIKQKLILAIGACMLGLAAVTAALVSVASERAVRFAAEQAVAAAGAGLGAMEQADVEKLDATVRALAAHPGLVEAFRARNRARFLSVATPIFRDLEQRHGITHFNAHLPDRTNFARVHRPEIFGDRVERATLAGAAATGARAAGKELGDTAFALRVVEPWVVGGEVIGYLELGEELGRFLTRLKQQTGDDYAMLVSKRDGAGHALLQRDAWRAMRSRQQRPDDWDAFPDFAVVDDTASDPAAFAGAQLGAIRAGGQLLAEVSRGERVFARGLVPLTEASGRAVGGVVVLHDITQLHDSMTRARSGILITLMAVAILMALLMLALVQQLVFARLDRMTTTLEDLGARLAGGEYDVGKLSPTGPRDEIGKFEEFFGSFLVVMGGLVKELTERRR